MILAASQRPAFYFSTNNQKPEEVVIDVETKAEEAEPVKQQTISQSESKEFKAETRKLLDIVAKSIYTDKEVFLRELLSNSSDALEKRRFDVQRGVAMTHADDDLHISITTNSKERTITIMDTGIGMDRDEVIDNLGTIAKSGSQAFVQ
jgi:HSP90 family molecular chaperone